jgi:hypothetical protein
MKHRPRILLPSLFVICGICGLYALVQPAHLANAQSSESEETLSDAEGFSPTAWQPDLTPGYALIRGHPGDESAVRPVALRRD